MAYLKIIEESQTWICPKTGDYKVTCVSGGQGGTYRRSTSSELYGREDGGATSFGNYVTASGYMGQGFENIEGDLGGGGGYDFFSYGGNGGRLGSPLATVNGGTGAQGTGYGAGGLGRGINGGKASSGSGGKLMLSIVHIDQGQSVACTIGKGGEGWIADFSPPPGAHGRDGVIVIQEV